MENQSQRTYAAAEMKGEMNMLKGIPEILSPELLKVLCEMGHSDRLVIADGNFPVESMGKNAITIRCDGHGVPEILDAILQLFPLDTYVEHPVNLMEVMPGDNVKTPIWDTYKEIIANTLNTLSKGGKISESFRGQWAFPVVAYEMLVTGESTGQLGLMMDKVAAHYNNLHKNAVTQVKNLIEPLTICLLAFAVGFILLSIIIPMFDLYNAVGSM